MYTLRFRLTLLVMLLLTGTLLAQGKTKNRRRRSASEKPLKTVPYRNIKQISKNIPTLEVADFLAIDLHSKFQLTRAGKPKYAVNWFNLGKYWGTFGDFGFDAPKEKYPVVVKEKDGCDVVEFKGKQYLRFELDANSDILETFTLEAWALNPSVEPMETLVSFGSKTPGEYVALNFGSDNNQGAFSTGWAGAGYPTAPSSEQWHHLVVTYDGQTLAVYVDGKKVTSAPMALKISSGEIFLGCTPDKKHFFSGQLMAVRIHAGVMTQKQITHNHAGGRMLGTRLLPNVRPGAAQGTYYADHMDPKMRGYYSEHWRTIWRDSEDQGRIQESGGKLDMKKLIPRQLTEYERYYALYSKKLAVQVPIVSTHINERGDGKRYLTDAGNNFEGSSWMGWNEQIGFGFPITGSGFPHGHEFAHVTQGHSMGKWNGTMWETHANWLPSQVDREHVNPAERVVTQSALFPSNGRNYYHDYLILDHLAESPEYGPLFIAKMWHYGGRPYRDTQPSTSGIEYTFSIFQRLDPDPETPIGYEFARLAQRSVTMDFAKGDTYRKAMTDKKNANILRQKYTILLEPVPYRKGWYRIPYAMEPMQLGWNVIPLIPTGSQVSMTLEGAKDFVREEYIRKPKWFFGFVAVNGRGGPTYSKIFTKEGEFRIPSGTKKLYLVVAAQPENLLSIGNKMNWKTQDGQTFGYEVKLSGAVPLKSHPMIEPRARGRRHSNGGGFVASTARASKSAYIGPHARVLGKAKIMGEAQIRGGATISGNAIVGESAIVSGQAIVTGSARVGGRARVGDFALVEDESQVQGDARVLEYARLVGKCIVEGIAVVKGQACPSGHIKGTAMIDGFFAKSSLHDKGVWFNWAWVPRQSDGEIDAEFAGLYLQYTFEGFGADHTSLAWDTFGNTNGRLVGGPKIIEDTTRLVPPCDVRDDGDEHALSLDGETQYIELPRAVAVQRDFTLDMEIRVRGEAKGQCILQFAGAKPERNQMTVTTGGVDGCPTFEIRVGGKSQNITSNIPLKKDTWHRLRVILDGDTGTMYVDDKMAGQNAAMTHNPQDVGARVCTIGRGSRGNFFQGDIDEVNIHSVATIDTSPPTPNPARILGVFPMSSSSFYVLAFPGKDPQGEVEYRFTEGVSKTDSGWISDPFWIDTGAELGTKRMYTVVMRDMQENLTAPSKTEMVIPKKVPSYQPNEKGQVIIEAEEYHNQVRDRTGKFAWRKAKGPNASGGYMMEVGPDTGSTAPGEFETEAARMDYRVNFTKPGDYHIWLRGYGPNVTSDSVYVGLDFSAITSENGAQVSSAPPTATAKRTSRWQRADLKKAIHIKKPGVHVINIWMREDGVLLDKLYLTQGGEAPSKLKHSVDNSIPVGQGGKASEQESQ